MHSNRTRQYVNWKSIAITVCSGVGVILALTLLTDYYLLPFAFLIALVSIVVILRWPFLGLLIYSVFLFVRPQEFISVLENSPVPIEKSIALLLIISVILKLKRERFTYKFNTIDHSIIAFALVTLISVPFSIWLSHSLETWQKVLRLCIIYFFIVHLINSKRQLQIFILLFISASVFHAFASVLNYYQGNMMQNVYMGIDRAIGIDKSFAGPNSLAATLVYTLPFMYYYFIAKRSMTTRLFLIMTAPVVVWCTILTGSRTGMVGMLFVIMLILWENKQRVRNTLIAAMLLVLVWIAMPGQYQDRFMSTTDLSSGTSASVSAHGRIDGLLLGIEMITKRPIIGHGIGCFSTARGTIFGVGNWHSAHSLPGEILGDIGILGTLVFCLWMYYLFKFLKREQKVFKAHGDKFLYLIAISLKTQLLCLLFLGLAGHNLLRFNWFVISAIAVVMMKLEVLNLTQSESIVTESPEQIDNALSSNEGLQNKS